MATYSSIERLHALIETNVTSTTGSLCYDRLTQAVIKLCDAVEESDSDSLWFIGENTSVALSDMIPAAYWHYSNYHTGQSSAGYQALSALGQIFNPNGNTSDPESSEYFFQCQLDDMAEA